MNLSSLVHAGRTQAEQQQQNLHNHHHHYYQPHQQEPQSSSTTTSLISPYMAHNDSNKSKYPCINGPHTPPSPLADESPKCSLPSISSLLVLVDSSSPQGQSQYTQPYSYNTEFAGSKLAPGQAHQNNYFDMGNQKCGSSPPINSRGIFPLTPPLNSDPGFDGRQSSPSVISNSDNSVSSVSNYELASNLSTEFSLKNHTESPDLRRRAPSFENKYSLSTQIRPRSQSSLPASDNHYQASHHRLSPFHPKSIQQSQSSSLETSGLPYQRPLPQQFSPSSMQIPTPNSTPNSTPIPQFSPANPWQHHHYISPSSTASFPQTQDRYICQTCNKAFSRPSSLRIHSHSHTGAKPFKCPHVGCGKAFSVRSNMKRHERGCHSSGDS
ncbi:C2H2 finger domain transcription factor mtfA [Erysiphe necator]|uniref:pH-response transcription factor pacC/RIM101 n=1 Tax=Uncinula necator TaxID=52586 RepID=A0A0B1P2J6_UNCNE|nr:C2H2 finger domain transcription factor mtfA [Erysiphe necator]KHJ31560.1 putative c2h2 type zinc finger containing protein [Erysiphe necator]